MAMRKQISRRGFTLAELVIGMAITTIVMTAMASFTMSVGTAWKASEDEQAASTMVNVSSARIGREIRAARLPGACSEGAIDGSAVNEAAVVIWRDDVNRDDTIQLSELELLAYEKTARAFLRYRPPAVMTDSNVSKAEFENESMISTIKSIFDRKILVGSIDGARLYSMDKSSTMRPTIEWVLRINQNGQVHTLSLTLTFRSAALPR